MTTINFILRFLFLICIAAETFQDFKNEMEQKVKYLANNMTQAYKHRCTDFYKNCEIKSYLGCDGTAQRKCFDDIPTPKDCKDYTEEGAYLSTTPTITLTPSQSKTTLDGEEYQFVCASGGIDQAFKDLDEGRDKRYAFSFIGSYQGISRNYPGTQDGCSGFDPRFRPWYVAATTGRKNVIIIIDTSGSMDLPFSNSATRISQAQEAAKSVIGTLGNGDTFGVVTFSNTASSLGYDRIVRATSEAKSVVSNEINQIKVNSTTNYLQGFKKAFEMLENAKRDEYGAILCDNPENIILFMTDGKPDSSVSIPEMYSYLDSETANHHINLFSYAIGGSENDDSSVNSTLLKEMSCRYSGILFIISSSQDSGSLVEIMREYYTYISNGVSITEPVWTEPYEDFFGMGQITTVAFPIYYTEADTPGIKIILGVAGIDVTLESLKRFGSSESEIITQLVSAIQCHNNDIGECEFESLRNSESSFAVCNQTFYGQCGDPGTIESDCNGQHVTTSNIFTNPEDTSNQKCCGELKVDTEERANSIIGIIVGVVIGVAVIIIVVIIVVKKKRSQAIQEKEQEYKYPETNNQIHKQQFDGSNQMGQQPQYMAPQQNAQYFGQPPPFGNPYMSPAPPPLGPYEDIQGPAMNPMDRNQVEYLEFPSKSKVRNMKK